MEGRGGAPLGGSRRNRGTLAARAHRRLAPNSVRPCQRSFPSPWTSPLDNVRVVGDAQVTRTGAQILVDGLAAQGADVAFGVPGESYLAVLDALLDSPIRYVTCRHEAGAANMAEAYGKLTGRPGVCMVTRGPGATHASRRRAHGVPGLDADAPDRRSGRARSCVGAKRSRRSTTRRCSRRSRSGRARSGTPLASRRSSRARTPWRRQADPVRSCSRCRRTCSSRRRTSATSRPCRRFRRIPARTTSPGHASCSREPSGRSCSSAGSRGAPRQRTTCGRSARRRPCRSARPSAARTTSTTARRRTWATSGSAPTRGSRRVCATRTCSSSSGRASAR